MPSVAQRSFSSGEIAPGLYPRVDTAKYAAAMRTIRKFQVKRSGGAENTAGTQFIGEIPFSFTKGRLIKFVFNASQTYELAFVDKKMFVIKAGAFITNGVQTATAITKANPGVVTIAGHGYSNGDIFDISGVVGMTQLNGRRLRIKGVATNTFQLCDMDGVTSIDTSAFGAYVSGGTFTKLYSVATPYAEADLETLHFIQSADTITFTHKKYPPYKLTRAGDSSWTFTPYQFGIVTATPAMLDVVNDAGTIHATPGGNLGYSVTAVDATSLEESLCQMPPLTIAYDLSVSGRYVTASWTAVPNAKYYNVYKATSVGGQLGFVGTVTGSTSYVDGYPGAKPDFANTPPTERNPFTPALKITAITRANPGVFTAVNHGLKEDEPITIAGVVGMTQVNGLSGFVSYQTPDTFVFKDAPLGGVVLDTSGFTAYTSGGTVSPLDHYPATAGYYQDRLGFASLPTDLEGAYFSKTSQYKNFSISQPLKDDDAITFKIPGREVNEIRHLVDLGTLVILTSGGEHAAKGNTDGVFKPSGVNRRQYLYNGASTVQPIVAGDSLLYIQNEGSIVYDLDAAGVSLDGMKASELTMFAPHLVDGLTITDWAYQKTPQSIVWARRSDGAMIAMTYNKQEQVVAWHRHPFGDGILDAVENVSVVPESGEHVLYLMTKRTVNGVARRFVERMYPRRHFSNRPMSSAEWFLPSCQFMEATLSFDGRNKNVLSPVTVSGGTLWSHAETLTLTAADPIFAATDVGKQFHILSSTDEVIRFTITAFTSTTVVSATPHKTVPVSMRSVATWQWARAITTCSGLWHLEGKKVSVLADGFVVASPNNAQYPVLTVSGGTITLPVPYCVVNVGLPMIQDLETLDIDTAQGESIAGKMRLIHEVCLFLENSRGGFIGTKPPSNDAVDPLEGLTELVPSNNSDYDTPPALVTDTVKSSIQSEWNTNGRVFLRQVDPLPLTCNAIVPSGAIPFGNGA